MKKFVSITKKFLGFGATIEQMKNKIIVSIPFRTERDATKKLKELLNHKPIERYKLWRK